MKKLLRDGAMNQEQKSSQSKTPEDLQSQFSSTLYAEYRDLKFGICTKNVEVIKKSVVEILQLKRDAHLYKSFDISARLQRLLFEVDSIIEKHNLDRDELDYLRLQKQIMHGGYTQGIQFSDN